VAPDILKRKIFLLGLILGMILPIIALPPCGSCLSCRADHELL
jgi:hypothetical protein